MKKDDQSLGSSERSMPGMPSGIPTGKLGTYRKAPPSDKNHVMMEKGKGETTQLGFNRKLGL